MCRRNAEGGDHLPSDFLATRIPLPPLPLFHSPDLIQEKIASPTAFCTILGGIFLFLCCKDVVDERLSRFVGLSSRAATHPSAVLSC